MELHFNDREEIDIGRMVMIANSLIKEIRIIIVRLIATTIVTAIALSTAGCGHKNGHIVTDEIVTENTVETIYTDTMSTENAEVVENVISEVEIPGKYYVFDDKKSEYEFDLPQGNTSETGDSLANGKLTVKGNIISNNEIEGKPDYAVETGHLVFSYTYSNDLINKPEDEEHLYSDSSKKVNDITLEEAIQNGAIIVQTSKDGEIWYTVPNSIDVNFFEEKPKGIKEFYETTDVQMINGCYYRILVAYETQKKLPPTEVLFVDIDNNYEYKKYLEVYTFHAYDNFAIKIEEPPHSDNFYRIGEVNLVKNYEGYTDLIPLTNDVHVGRDIGKFYVAGYTSQDIDADKNDVFYKNNDDRISLWFDLETNINRCFGEESVTVVDDNKARDDYFGVPVGKNNFKDFGKGTLFIRQTDNHNNSMPVQIFTNFLEASASIDSKTKVDLFEEGDYEVGLDYGLKYDKAQIFGKTIIPETHRYKIFFKFSVRNGNSMVYLFDTQTGSELSGGSITPNGFRIDLANSKYLSLTVKREVLRDGYSGLVEDAKLNSVASDGDEFTTEGLYTVTAKNKANGIETTKLIYVGDNNILKAYMVTGLSISDIKDKLNHGAIIEEDGTITEPIIETPEPNPTSSIEKSQNTDESKNAMKKSGDDQS